MRHQYWVYILSNRRRTVYYIGVTNNLERRLTEHKEQRGSIFTSKYAINELIYFEEYGDVRDAIAREKQLKGWKRSKKLELVYSINPTLRDLAQAY